MNDRAYVLRARLRLATLGALVCFTAAALMFLVALLSSGNARLFLASLGVTALAVLLACLLEIRAAVREIEQDEGDDWETREDGGSDDWERTKEKLRQIHRHP